jgi:hypothetical protein
VTPETIDIEPSWVSILNVAKSIRSEEMIEELRQPCLIADVVRQATKHGKSVTFYPTADGKVRYEVAE